MESCNLVGAVNYLEKLHSQLLVEDNVEAAELLSAVVKEVSDARNDIINKSALVGARVTDIHQNLSEVFAKKGKKKGKAKQSQRQEAPTYETVAGFKLGEVREIEMAEFIDLAGDIAKHADMNRFGKELGASQEDIDSISKLLKLHLGSSGRRVKVELVSDVIVNVGGKERAALGNYKRSTGVLSVAMNPDPKSLSKASLLIPTGKVVLHELVHAMTVQILDQNKALDAKVESLRKHAVAMYKSANNGKEPSYEPGSATYGLKNTKEFVAEVITSRELQKLLAGINPTKTENIVSRVKDIFNKIVSEVKASMGIPEDTYTLLDEAVEAVTAVLDNDDSYLTEGEKAVVDAVTGNTENRYIPFKGDVISYKGNPYIVRGINSSGKLNLTSMDGKNFSGTPNKDQESIEFIRRLALYAHTDNNEYMLDFETKKVYSKKGETNHSKNEKTKMFEAYVDAGKSYNNSSTSTGNDEDYFDEDLNTESETVKDRKKAEAEASKDYEFDGGEGRTFTTNEGQTAAIDTMKNWYKTNDPKKPHFLLQGRGGTGKTTVINVLLDELDGVEPGNVMFAAFMHKASKVLEDANKDNKYGDSEYTTIASILALRPTADGSFVRVFGSDPRELPKVLVVDEVSMLRSDHYKELVNLAAQYGTRIIFMGDHAQIPPVNDPDPAAKIKSVVFKQQEHSTTHLNKLMRQAEGSPIITTTDSLISLVNYVEDVHASSSSKAEKTTATELAVSQEFQFNGEWFNRYDEETGEGVLTTKDNFEDILPHIVNDLKNDITGTKYLHYNNHLNNKSIDKTDAIRNRLFSNSREELYIKGEPLMLNGPYTVFSANSDEDFDTVLDNAEEFIVRSSSRVSKPLRYKVGTQELKTTSNIDMYEIVAYSESRKEEFTFLKPSVREGKDVNQLVNKLMLEEGPKVPKSKKGLDMSWLARNALKTYLAFDLTHSYVMNTHKSQGSSYTNVYLDAGNILGVSPDYVDANNKAKSLYVGASRPKKRLVVIDSRYNGSVDNGVHMKDVPIFSYAVAGVNTAEATKIIDEVTDCKGPGN